MAAKKKIKTIEVPFKADEMDGDDLTMDLKGLKPLQLKFGSKSRNITIVCQEVVKKKPAKKK